MKHVDKLASCKELFEESGILTVPSLIIKHNCMQIKRNIDTFSEKGIHSEYNLRDRKKLAHAGNRTQNLQTDLYNSLPVHIKDLSYKAFKIHLNQFLIKTVFIRLMSTKSSNHWGTGLT